MTDVNPTPTGPALKPTQIDQALEMLIDINQPSFIWGPPGVGKSQIVQQVAARMKRELVDVRAVLLDPVDLRGLPHINGDGRAHWAIPDFLPRGKKPTVLFLDELNAAPPLVQAACYQLILDRRLGDYVLPDNVALLAAGNRETDRAVTSRMPSALANRFVHVEFAVDVDDWSAWAVKNDIAVEVIAFVRFRPELLHYFDPTSAEKAFPSPRAWSFVSQIFDRAPSHDVLWSLLAGTVGEGAAAEFSGFVKVFREMPSLDGILLNPDREPVPEDPAALYAVATGLARKASDANFDRIVTYADRMPEEFNVLLVKDATLRNGDIKHTKAFIQWGSDHSDALI